MVSVIVVPGMPLAQDWGSAMQKPASTGKNQSTVPAVCTVPFSTAWKVGHDAGSAMQNPNGIGGRFSLLSELNLMVTLVTLVPVVPVVVIVSLMFPSASATLKTGGSDVPEKVAPPGADKIRVQSSGPGLPHEELALTVLLKTETWSVRS